MFLDFTPFLGGSHKKVNWGFNVPSYLFQMERVKSNSNVKGIDKVVPVHTLKAGRGSTATAPHTINSTLD